MKLLMFGNCVQNDWHLKYHNHASAGIYLFKVLCKEDYYLRYATDVCLIVLCNLKSSQKYVIPPLLFAYFWLVNLVTTIIMYHL